MTVSGPTGLPEPDAPPVGLPYHRIQEAGRPGAWRPIVGVLLMFLGFALFGALVAPRKALAVPAGGAAGAVSVESSIGIGQVLRGLGISSVPLLLALATLGTTWWYVVIYSQQVDRPAVTATQPADAQVARAASTQALPGPVPAGGGLQEPPAAADSGGSSTGLSEPPAAPTPADSVAVVMPNRITASTTKVRMPSGMTEDVSIRSISNCSASKRQ